MSDYDIREVRTDADRASVFRLRYDLYVADQGLFGDVADHERRWLVEPEDEHATLWIAEADGETVATGRLLWGGDGRFDRNAREAFDIDAFTDLIDERDMAIGSRVMVKPALRGKLLEVAMMKVGWARAVERGTELILGECEPHLVNKWMRLGFRPYGLCEHPINGTLVRAAYVLGDFRYVRDMGSPLADTLRAWNKPGDAFRRLGERLARGQRIVSEQQDRQKFWDEVERSLPRAELARHLGGLSDDQLDALLGNGHALDCHPGAVLIRKGHVSRTLYVLLTGSLVVRDGGAHIAEVSEPGAVLGEVAFFSRGERISDVLAGSAGARVLALSERNLRALIDAEGASAAKFLLSLTQGLCVKLRERSRSTGADDDATPP